MLSIFTLRVNLLPVNHSYTGTLDDLVLCPCSAIQTVELKPLPLEDYERKLVIPLRSYFPLGSIWMGEL